jgi:long-subunit fatty acid transport protein
VTNDLKLGFALNSYFAGSNKYDSAWVGRYFNQEASLVSASFTPSVAYRATDWISFGAGLNVMQAQYNTQVAFHNVNALGVTTAPDGQISTNSTNTGVGGNIGVLLTPREGTRIGVDWLSQVNLKFSGVPHCTGVATGAGNTSGNILTASGLCTHESSLGQKVPPTSDGECLPSNYRKTGSRSQRRVAAMVQEWAGDRDG